MQEKEINRLRQVHLGKILSNFTILLFIVLLLTAAMDVIKGIAMLFAMIAMLLVFMVLLVSLFTLYPWFESLNVGSWFDSNGTFMTFFEGIKNALHTACPYLFVITVLFSALSIFLLLRDRNSKHVGRIVFAGIATAVGIIAMVVTYCGGAF